MRIAAGLLEPLEGAVAIDGHMLYMAQDVGTGEGSVRELLLGSAPARLARRGRAVLTAERELADGDESAGMRLGEAIGTWSGLGGYELEGAWDAACRRIVRRRARRRSATGPRDAVGRRAQAARARGAVRLRRRGAAARRARQLPRRPRQAGARGADPRDEEDGAADQPRPRAAERGLRRDRHARGRRLLGPRRLLRDLPRGARAPPGADGRPAQRWKDEEQRLRELVRLFKERAKYSPDWAKKADAMETRWQRWVDDGPPPAPVVDQLDQGAPARRRLGAPRRRLPRRRDRRAGRRRSRTRSTSASASG